MIVIALISEFELPSLEIACVALSARVKRSKSRQILLKGSHSWKARAGLHRRLQRRLRRPGHDALMRQALAGRNRLWIRHQRRRDRVARTMQPPSCQHDDLACLPRSQTGPRCRRGPSASGRQHRAASRCSGRMVSPVRSARFDATAITYARKSAVVNAPGMAPLNKAASAGESLVRQERDFWMRRPNRRKRQRTSAETKTAQNR